MLKKLFMLLVSTAFICSNVNADTICVKKKITAKGKVSLARNIKVIKGDTCPNGFTALVNTDTFVGPQGEKGEKGDDGLDGANYFDTQFLPNGQTLTGIVGGHSSKYVSLQVPSGVQIEIANPWECDGSVEIPTAPAGKVCIYPIYGVAKAQSIPTSSKIELNNQSVCEANGYEWKEAYCIANKDDGVTAIDSDTECSSGPYNNGNTWNGVTETCTRSRYDKVNCETPIYSWDETKACFVEGILGHQTEEQCNDETNGYWIEKGCSDYSEGNILNSAFPDKKSCLTPARGTWIPARCEVTQIASDLAYGDYSNAGFKVDSPNGGFVVVWAYTAPEVM